MSVVLVTAFSPREWQSLIVLASSSALPITRSESCMTLSNNGLLPRYDVCLRGRSNSDISLALNL